MCKIQSSPMKLSKIGQMGGSGWAIISLFLVLTILAVLQQVSLLTVSKVSANIDRGQFTAAQNTTIANLEDNNLDAFELGGTAQIVLGASIILVAVIGLITAFKGRG